VHRTRVGTLIWAFVFGVPVGWLIARAVRSSGNGLPPIPAVLPILLGVLAVAGIVAARWVRAWVDERKHERHLDALRVARLVAMAKAGSIFGAVVGGLYAGIVLVALELLDVPLGRSRAIVGGIVVLTAVAVSVSALVLERACEAPPPPQDDDPPSAPQADPSA
jgi:ABC-type xylose transport system permease subunit